jgi:hypothetical protein
VVGDIMDVQLAADKYKITLIFLVARGS